MIKEEKSDSPGFSRRSFLKRLTLALVGVWAPKKIGHLITGPEFNVAHAQDHLLSKIELCRENISRIQELYRLFGFETSSTADSFQAPRWIGFGPPVKWETQPSAQDRARNCEVAHVAAREEVEKRGGSTVKTFESRPTHRQNTGKL